MSPLKTYRRWVTLPFSAILICAAALLLPSSKTAESGHFTNWLNLQAPYAGYWNKTICPDPGDPYTPQCAAPQNHHRPWAGDWATDFYQTPGAAGSFRIANSNGGTAYGYLPSPPGSSCSGSTWAGYAYKFSVYDGTGQRGWYLLAHVSGSNGIDPEYVLGQYTTVYNGTFVGYTAFWGTSTCYNVTTFGGVHWHVEMSQPTHYACWKPWSPGSSLGVTDMLGAVGSNALSAGASCW